MFGSKFLVLVGVVACSSAFANERSTIGRAAARRAVMSGVNAWHAEYAPNDAPLGWGRRAEHIALIQTGPTTARFIVFNPVNRVHNFVGGTIVGTIDLAKRLPAGSARVDDVQPRYGSFLKDFKGPRVK